MKTQDLIKNQTLFMGDFSKLISYLISNGYYICPGELRRSNDKLPCIECGKEQSRQEMLINAGRSWTQNSRHLDGLAIDLTLFKIDEDNKLVQITQEEYEEIGRYWEGLSVENIHGLKKGDDGKDVYHFERRVTG
jgi:hypothetical protein